MTRREWMDRAAEIGLIATDADIWERLANLAEEVGPFKPEVEVVWECSPLALMPGWRLLANGVWLVRGAGAENWNEAPIVGGPQRELARIKLAEWRAAQGHGDQEPSPTRSSVGEHQK